MSSTSARSNRKRKAPTSDDPEAVVSSDDQIRRKAHRVSTDTQASTVASHEMADEVSVVNVASTAITDPEASAESNGALIQDLFQSDNAKVNVALDALDPNGSKDSKKRESIVTVGGCLAVVQVVRSVSKRRLRRFQRVIESLSWTNSMNCKLLTSHSVSLPTWRMITMKA
jgi:hypothetical protein